MSATRRLTDEERRIRRNVRALRRGERHPQPCEVCGAEPAECHHIDYADPERVMWLCKPHHAQTHSQFGKPAPEWTADIRSAVRAIERQRLALRARRLQEGHPPEHYAGIAPGALPAFGTPATALPPPQVVAPKNPALQGYAGYLGYANDVLGVPRRNG